MQSFYTAAVLLQQEYADRLRPFVGERWRWLPDLLSKELGLPTQGEPRERLRLLDRELRHRTQAAVNWMGTYEQVVQKLILISTAFVENIRGAVSRQRGVEPESFALPVA